LFNEDRAGRPDYEGRRMASPANTPDEVLLDGKFLRYVRRGNWEFVQRKKVTGIVGIVAITAARKLLLVEQYRVPLKRNVIEIPAGLAGDVAGHETEPLENA
jgi:ADP-ribose pyrophosphatase